VLVSTAVLYMNVRIFVFNIHYVITTLLTIYTYSCIGLKVSGVGKRLFELVPIITIVTTDNEAAAVRFSQQSGGF
jgi:hypothetical protein